MTSCRMWCFHLVGTEFKISEVDDTVRYLKITIDTVETLSLLHLFMWQHRQGLLLRSDIQLIIIQDDLKDPSVSVSDYWLNLVSLSIQMGFSVLSYQVIGDEEIQKLAEVQVQSMKSDHEIVIVSKNSAIDSKLFPNCIVSKKESKQQDQNEKDNQVEDYKLTQPQFKIPSNFSIVEKQAILQIIGIALHKFKIYAHLLPMIFGYSAYLIYQQMLYSNAIDPTTIYQSAGKSILSTNQQIYNDAVMSTNFQNFFELPVHLLKILEFNDTNKFIFQQMCNVSYLFKAQYFAVFSAFFPIENAVMSQSSRSGKTVTLHTIFYFNLFSGLKIPILINTGFTEEKQKLDTQPLYDRSSIKIGQQLKTLFCKYQRKTKLGDIISSNLKDGIEYSKTMAYVKAECFKLIKNYDMLTLQILLKNIFVSYFTGTSSFEQFSLSGGFNFFNYQQADQLKQIQVTLSEELKQLQKQIENNKENNEVQLQIEHVSWRIKQYKNGFIKPNKNVNLIQEFSKNKQITILVDECLSQQKTNYALCTRALVRITNLFVVKFMENAKSSIDEVLLNIKEIAAIDLIYLLDWLEIRKNGLEIDTVQRAEQPQYLKEAEQKVEYIRGDSAEIERYFLRLIPSELFKNCKAYKIIDLMGISSPNFINLRQSQKVEESFQEMISDVRKYSTLEVFTQKLYQFLLMLYNPRGIETIFWRNIYYFMNQQSDATDELVSQIKVKNKLNKQYTYLFKHTLDINIKFPNQKVYEKIPFISVKTVHLLAAGTDLALINFIRQNEFLYTSENSRDGKPYRQSNILGTSQMHPSCLTQRYYKDMRITTQTDDSMIQQVKDKVKNMSINDFYLTMIPDLAAELQFLCPLICPQIIINKGQYPYFFNSTKQFQFKVNKKKIPLNQISSHSQIYNSLFIMRDKELVGASQLVQNEKETMVVLIPSSIADFNKNLHLTSSSSLNRDVVFVLHFMASQQFMYAISKLIGVSDKHQLNTLCSTGQILSFFKQQQISEISSMILLVISLCRQQPAHLVGIDKLFKQIINYSQYLEIYVNPLQVQQNNDITLIEMYAQFQSLFKGAFFMFLQKSFDKYWNVDKPDIDMYVRDAIQNASVCYVKLKQLGLLQKDEKLAIVTITDKTCISNLFFETSPPMPDYLISLFGVEDTIRDSFSNKKMLSIKTHDVDEEKVSSINLLMDSGNHTGEEMFKKQKDTGIATCFQVTNKYQQNFKQICLHHQVSPQYEARTEKVEAYQAQKEVKVLSEVKAKVEQLNNDVAQANDKVEQLKNEVVKADGKVEQLKNEVVKADGNVEQLKNEVVKADGKVEQLKNEVVKADGNVEQLKNEVVKADGKVEQLKNEVVKADGKVEQLKNEVVKADGKVEQLKNEVDEAEGELTTAKLKVKELKVEVKELKVEVKELKVEVKEAEAELTTAKLKVNQAEAELTTAKLKVNQAEAELTTAKLKVNQAEAELTTAKLKVNQAEAELTTAKAKASQPNIDAKNIVIQYEKRQEYAMLNAKQEIKNAEKALLQTKDELDSPIKQFNIKQAELQLQQANTWQQILTENTNKDNDIEKAAIKAQAEFEMLQAKYDNIIHSQQIKHMAEKVINVNYQIQLLEQGSKEAEEMLDIAKSISIDTKTSLLSKQRELRKFQYTLESGVQKPYLKTALDDLAVISQQLGYELVLANCNKTNVETEISDQKKIYQDEIKMQENALNYMMPAQEYVKIIKEDLLILEEKIVSQLKENEDNNYYQLSQVIDVSLQRNEQQQDKLISKASYSSALSIPLIMALRETGPLTSLYPRRQEGDVKYCYHTQEQNEILIKKCYNELIRDKTWKQIFSMQQKLQAVLGLHPTICVIVFQVFLIQFQKQLGEGNNNNAVQQDQTQKKQANVKKEFMGISKKVFALGIFQLVNYTRQFNNLNVIVNCLINISEPFAENIFTQIQQITKQNKLISIIDQQSEEICLQIYMLGLQLTDINKIFGILIVYKVGIENCYIVKVSNQMNIYTLILATVIPLEIYELKNKIANTTALKVAYQSKFAQLGKFCNDKKANSLCIQGVDIMWVANSVNFQEITAKKVNQLYVLQILEQINTCLVNSSITYKKVGEEDTYTQILNNRDIVGFLLGIHLFPVSIDGTTLIVDQLTDDNKQFLIPSEYKK
uniref:Dynein heavy chain n=1 Tax=Spironucleus salmonicida TaxID=348837 RepID=V6LLP0_9EUKA|eukprot:EST45492.1 Hypothetical protein SS50377_14564 [Spironucleus salmonicida]